MIAIACVEKGERVELAATATAGRIRHSCLYFFIFLFFYLFFGRTARTRIVHSRILALEKERGKG